MYPAPLVSWLLLVIVQFNVTVPLVPPPLIPVPAVTPVISPCGIDGNVVKSPNPLTYCAEVPCQIPVIVPEVVIAPEATFKAVPSVINFTLVTVPVFVVYPEPLLNWLLLVGKPVAVKVLNPFLVNVSVPEA